MATKQKIVHHWQLEVFQLAREAAQKFFHLSKRFPVEERYSLTDQGRRASRAVSAMISEACEVPPSGWTRAEVICCG
jgi:hypothetical protein